MQFSASMTQFSFSTVPPTITPVLTPSLGGFLTPLSAPVMPVTSASVQVCNASHSSISILVPMYTFVGTLFLLAMLS
jgi:hypothetical protein